MTRKALQLLDKAIAKDPRYIDAYDLKGNILKNLGRFDEAKNDFPNHIRH